MLKLIQLWIEQVNQKQSLRTMLKDLSFSFQLWIENKKMTVMIQNGLIKIEEFVQSQTQNKRLEGDEELFLSILLGERKLREAVNSKEISSNLSFRELLLLESLFYLGKSELIGHFSAKIYQ